MKSNDWALLAHPAFLYQLENYRAEFVEVKRRFGEDWDKSQIGRRYLAFTYSFLTSIPGNPESPKYLQGNTLGPKYRAWRRAKFLQQYRIFFRYSSKVRTIIYGWVNDSETLRAYGAKTDAYIVFRKMLEAGKIPNDWDELIAESKKL